MKRPRLRNIGRRSGGPLQLQIREGTRFDQQRTDRFDGTVKGNSPQENAGIFVQLCLAFRTEPGR